MADEGAVPVHGGVQPTQRPRIAAFNLDEGDRLRFVNAFRNVKLSVDIVAVSAVSPGDAFDAAILRADGHAAPILTALRAHSKRMILYLVGPMPEIARLAHFGVNAALEGMTDAAIARAVETTYLLLAGKLRRYTRVPLYVPVRLQAGTVSFTAITEDLSGGGISVHSAPGTMLRTGQPVTVRLMLPGTEPLNVHGIICRVSGGQVGVQFERDPEQERLRKWVDEFLE